MVRILYTHDRAFMRKTFAAIDRHVEASSARLALGPEASEPDGPIEELSPRVADAADYDRAVFDVDPDVVVENHRFAAEVLDDRPEFYDSYPVVHVRHGASVGRGEVENTTEAGVVETAHAKEQAIASAAEAANLVLKIDDIISAGDLSPGGDDDEGGAPAGGMGGMGGMGGAM